MALVFRSVYDFTSSACQAVAHAILRDLTNYYWEKEKLVLEQRNESSSLINEDATVPTEEYIFDTKHDKNGNSYEKLSVEVSEVKENDTYEEVNENADSSTISSAEGYTLNALGDNFEQNCYNKTELFKDLEVLKGNTSDFLIKIQCEYDPNGTLERDKLNSGENNNTESEDECGIHLVLHTLSSTIQNTIQTTREDSVVESFDDLTPGDYLQNSNKEIHETKIADVEDVISAGESLICEGHHQPITLKSEDNNCQKCFSEDKICDKFSSEEKIENTMETFQNCFDFNENIIHSENTNESLQAEPKKIPLTLKEGLKRDEIEISKLFDQISEATGLIETFSDIDSDSYNEEWIKRFLSDALPQSTTKHEDESTAAEVEGCNCLKMHSCLLDVDWEDDKVELLTKEQLHSVETGSVSDWLYSVSPAICLLASNDIFGVTKEEIQSIHDQETQMRWKQQLDCYENIIKNFYIEKWLDSSENYCLKSLHQDYGSGDFPLLKI